jgi:hypothetical protein
MAGKHFRPARSLRSYRHPLYGKAFSRGKQVDGDRHWKRTAGFPVTPGKPAVLSS